MAKQRYINTRFWNDGYISNLPWRGRLLFLYLLTNDKTNISGVYEIPNHVISFETGLSRKEVATLLDQLERDGKIKRVDSWVALKNFLKYQVLNPKTIAGITYELSQSPVELVKFIGWTGKLVSKPKRKKIGSHIRSQVLKMGGHRCAICKKGKADGVTLEIDHIKPVSVGGDNSISNLRVLCQQCNGKRNADLRWGDNGWQENSPPIKIGGLSHLNSNPDSNSNLRIKFSEDAHE